MIGDGKGMVVLRIGYNELAVPAKAATMFMEFIANGGAYRFDSKWMQSEENNGRGHSMEVIEPAEIEIKHLPLERVALAKLNTVAYQQYQEEKEKKT